MAESPVTVLETDRLRFRQLTVDDADFILRLVNDPAWLRFIGDRGVRTTEDARNYILQRSVASYAQHGFGIWLVALKTGAVPIGTCGLLRRETMPDVELGFAFLPEYRGQGFAREAGQASLAYGRTTLGFTRIVAITDPRNERSIKTLGKLGLQFERLIRLPNDPVELQLFATPA